MPTDEWRERARQDIANDLARRHFWYQVMCDPVKVPKTEFPREYWEAMEEFSREAWEAVMRK